MDYGCLNIIEHQSTIKSIFTMNNFYGDGYSPYKTFTSGK